MKQQITILGISMNVATDSADPLYVLDVARHVDETAQKLMKNAPPKTTRETIAVMTALEIADELYRRAATALPEGRRAQSRVDAMVRKIDEALERK